MTIGLFGNIIGVIGMILVMVVYFLTQNRKINSSDLLFIHLNLIGGLLLLGSLLVHFNLASFLLEVSLIGISLYGYYNHFRINIEKKKIVETTKDEV